MVPAGHADTATGLHGLLQLLVFPQVLVHVELLPDKPDIPTRDDRLRPYLSGSGTLHGLCLRAIMDCHAYGHGPGHAAVAAGLLVLLGRLFGSTSLAVLEVVGLDRQTEGLNQ